MTDSAPLSDSGPAPGSSFLRGLLEGGVLAPAAAAGLVGLFVAQTVWGAAAAFAGFVLGFVVLVVAVLVARGVERNAARSPGRRNTIHVGEGAILVLNSRDVSLRAGHVAQEPDEPLGDVPDLTLDRERPLDGGPRRFVDE